MAQNAARGLVARLQGRAALITGASGGIGRAIALRYAAEGARVVVADREEKARAPAEAAATTSELIRAMGGTSVFCKVDVADRASVEAAVGQAVAAYGRLDVMVNNAGIAPEIEDPRPVWRTSDAVWNSTLAVNSTGVFYSIAAATKQMVQQDPLASGDRGWIVNLSSTYGQTAIAGSVSYCASKHLVLGLTKAAALDCAPYRVHVNAICPGYTQSAMTAPLFIADPNLRAHVDQVHPFRGMGSPEDIAKMAVVLGSDDASWMTGAAVAVDGGYLTQ